MAGLVNYSAVLQDAGGSNLRFVASEHKFQTWGAGQSGASALSGILASSNQTTVMTIRGSNVGIGVTAPVAKLQVAGGVGIGTAYAAIAPPTDGCIVAGNVGIGTANPVATLQVAGSVGIGAAYAAFTPPADGCIVAGNVGIGTTNPLAKLHVNGDIIGNIKTASTGIAISSGYTGEMIGTLRSGTNGYSYSVRSTTPISNSVTYNSICSQILNKGIYLISFASRSYVPNANIALGMYITVGGTAVTETIFTTYSSANAHYFISGGPIPIGITVDNTTVALYGFANGASSTSLGNSHEMWIVKIN